MKHKQNLIQKGRGVRQHKSYLVSIAIFSILFLFIPFISAQPPMQQSSIERGLVIESAYPSIHTLNEDFYIHVHVYNASNGVLMNTDISCYYHSYNHNLKGGEHISTGNLTQVGVGFQAYLGGNLLNETGEYSNLLWCNSSTEGGFLTYTFDVTSTSSFQASLFFIILVTSLAVIFLLTTLVVNEEFFAYISGILWLMGGIYLMINGLDILNDTNTRNLAYIYLGIGLLFTLGAYVFNSYNKWRDEEY